MSCVIDTNDPCPVSQRGTFLHEGVEAGVFVIGTEECGNKILITKLNNGESVGSLTKQFGDRLNVRKETTMKTRVTARIFCYQIKLLIIDRDDKIVLLLYTLAY